MNLSIWAGAVTTLLGAIIGGAISFTLSRQQIKANQIQQDSDRLHQDRQRSIERRFQVYSDFLIRSRSFRNALMAYYLPSDTKPSVETLDDLLHAAQDSAALVFLTLENEDTRSGCVRMLHVLGTAQRIIHDVRPPTDDPWQKLRSDFGQATRTFESAARRELGVLGSSKPWIPRDKAAHPESDLPLDNMLDLPSNRITSMCYSIHVGAIFRRACQALDGDE